MTTYRVDEAVAVLERTPRILRAWLADLPEAWVRATEGPGTWSAFDVVGHLIHGERTDWIPRTELVLDAGRVGAAHGSASGSAGTNVPREEPAFTPFDREAMFQASKGQSLDALLDTFETLRAANVARLIGLALTEADLDLRGRHPEFGSVTLRQHLATWVAHDLSHLAQIARVMAKRYQADAGPWTAYLSILK
jgi:DinB superfamily